jgi:hypothetical protein
MKRASLARLSVAMVVIAGWASSSCAPSGFQDANLINSVRILTSSSDEPYAEPGATVTTQVLAYDGRPSQPEPMTVYWLPVPCIDPANDAYYACFSGLFGGGQDDAGTPDGTGGTGGPSLDLTGLPTGPSFTFTMPTDAITKHPTVAGSVAPYGLAILFNIACAGHLERVPLDPNNVQSPPIGCFDAQNTQLSATDYVIGFTRVYAYTALTNANPVIQSVDLDGTALAIAANTMTPVLDVTHCTGKCVTTHIGPVVPASSQQPDPASHDAQGNMLKEQIWAEFFSTIGSFSDDVRLLYDPSTGSLGPPSDTDDTYTPPSDPGDGFIWIVVHDNRGGASWATVPVHVE